jgi:beta-glucosidase
MNLQYLDPVFLGRYPEALAEVFGDAWPKWPAEDFALIRQPIDFVGVNYYTRSVVRHDPGNWLLHASRVKQKGALYTETDWEVFPRGFYDTLVWVKDRYGNPPVYVTENGAAFADPPKTSRGKLADPKRVAYYRSHLKALRDARAVGCDVRGYFAWSVLDNLEWSLGFSKRFGIVHVDFATQKRTPKDSAKFYSQVIATNGAILDEEPGRRR